MREKAKIKAYERPRIEMKIRRFGVINQNISGLQNKIKELME